MRRRTPLIAAVHELHPSIRVASACDTPRMQPGSALSAALCGLLTVTLPLVGLGSVEAAATPPDECKIARTARGDEGFPPPKRRIVSHGSARTAFIFVDFSDAPATQSTEDVLRLMEPGSNDQFRQLSYGRFRLDPRPLDTWLRMPQPISSYGSGYDILDHTAYIRTAIASADPIYDFSKTDIVVVVAPPTATQIATSPATLWAGVVADGHKLNFATTMFSDGYDLDRKDWNLTHEVSHLLGLPDLYAARGPGGGLRFTGAYDLMGQIWDPTTAPEMFAWHRWLLGWIDDRDIRCVAGRFGTARLSSVSSPGGVRALIVRLSKTRAVVAEVRSAAGLDAASTTQGVLVYTVDSRIGSGRGPIRVQQLPTATAPEFRDAPLQPGQQITVDRVTFMVKAGQGGSYTVAARARSH